MGRPPSFDGLPLREPKNPQREGGRFQDRVCRGLERLGGWTARFTDTVNVDANGNLRRTASVSPPDFIHCGRRFNLLVECKTFIVEPGYATATVDFVRLEPHQLEDLVAFDEVSSRHHGFIAILFYNREQGKDRVYRCFLIPIMEWVRLDTVLDRKSIPKELFNTSLAPYEALWVGGNKSYFDFRRPIAIHREDSR